MNNRRKIYTVFGILLVLIGIFIPSSMLVEFLRMKPESAKLYAQLLLGATILKIGLIILVILLIATALRLYGFDYGLWYDEIMTYGNYMDKSFGEIITTALYRGFQCNWKTPIEQFPLFHDNKIAE